MNNLSQSPFPGIRQTKYNFCGAVQNGILDFAAALGHGITTAWYNLDLP